MVSETVEITWLLDIQKVRLEETFWSLESFLAYFDYTTVREGVIFDKDGRFFCKFVVQLEIVTDIA